jgi:hypothetical protein
MVEETTRDLPPVNDDTKSDFRAVSTAPMTSSSPTLGAIKMADKKSQ